MGKLRHRKWKYLFQSPQLASGAKLALLTAMLYCSIIRLLVLLSAEAAVGTWQLIFHATPAWCQGSLRSREGETWLSL